MSPPSSDVTALLAAVSQGEEAAWSDLLEVVYRELHRLAHGALQHGRPGPTVQTTALVNEAFLRLVRDRDERWANRSHFFRVAARAMRQILVDEYRRRRAEKRGAPDRRIPLAEAELAAVESGETESAPYDLDALDHALERLAAQPRHRRKGSVIELRFFVGLTLEETADVLGISLATVARDWEFARAWLLREMAREGGHAS